MSAVGDLLIAWLINGSDGQSVEVFAAVCVIAPAAHIIMSARNKSANTRPLCENHSPTWFKCRCSWDGTAGSGKFGVVKSALCGLVKDGFNRVIVGIQIMFIETRCVSLKSMYFFAIISEVTPSRSEIEAVWVAAEKLKDVVWFVFWWRSANERVGCEWWGRRLVVMVIQVGNHVGMGGVVCIKVSVGCEKHGITHGA